MNANTKEVRDATKILEGIIEYYKETNKTKKRTG